MNEAEERKAYDDWLHRRSHRERGRAALAQPEPAAPTEPAPGWCKHCQQYTIEEPLKAAPTVVEPVAWMSPGRERLEFSRADTVYGSHTIPLYRHPPRTALTEECLSLLDTAMDSLKYHQEQTRPIHLTQVTIQAIQEFLEKHQIGGPRNE
jgi:hypothetical protein